MKHFIYLAVLASMAACSTEEATTTESAGKSAFKNLDADDDGVANAANPYDNSGTSYLLLNDAYESTIGKPTDNTAVLNAIEGLASGLNLLKPSYNASLSQNIEGSRDFAETNSVAFIQGLDLQPETKGYLTTTLNQLANLKSNDVTYDSVYTALVTTEEAIDASTISQDDKQVLLTTLSIVRYSLYNKSRRKRRDRDWEISVGNFLMIAYGATESEPNALINGVATDFIE